MGLILVAEEERKLAFVSCIVSSGTGSSDSVFISGRRFGLIRL